MIYGHIASLDIMRSWLPAPLAAALRYLRDTDLAALPLDEHITIVPGITMRTFTITTKPLSEARPEVHARNIDIQFLRTGRARMGFAADTGNNPVAEDKLAERDVLFYASAAGESFAYFEPGHFAVFFPHDVHRPDCMAADAPEDVLKVVVKVPVILVQ